MRKIKHTGTTYKFLNDFQRPFEIETSKSDALYTLLEEIDAGEMPQGNSNKHPRDRDPVFEVEGIEAHSTVRGTNQIAQIFVPETEEWIGIRNRHHARGLKKLLEKEANVSKPWERPSIPGAGRQW